MNTPKFDVNKKSIPRSHNRGFDTKHDDNTDVSVSIGLYTIDNAILKFLQTKIKPIVTQDGKQIQLPIMYGNPERWKSIQRDGVVRDNNGKILLPIMMIRRTSMTRNAINSPVNKYQSYSFETGWNSRTMYDRFSVLNGISPSKIYHTTMVPDHYDFVYESMIWTEYMEQMNKIVENVSFESNEYWGEDNNYRFISRIDQFHQITDLPSGNDRMVRSRFNINVRAYILPESALDDNQNRVSTNKVNYTPKKVVFSSEIVTNFDK